MRTWKDFIAPRKPSDGIPNPTMVYARRVMRERYKLMEMLE